MTTIKGSALSHTNSNSVLVLLPHYWYQYSISQAMLFLLKIRFVIKTKPTHICLFICAREKAEEEGDKRMSYIMEETKRTRTQSQKKKKRRMEK